MSLSLSLHARLFDPPPAFCCFRSCFSLSLCFVEEVDSLHSHSHTHTHTHTLSCPLLSFILLPAFLSQCGTFVCSTFLPSSSLPLHCCPCARQNILFFHSASWMSVVVGMCACAFRDAAAVLSDSLPLSLCVWLSKKNGRLQGLFFIFFSASLSHLGRTQVLTCPGKGGQALAEVVRDFGVHADILLHFPLLKTFIPTLFSKTCGHCSCRANELSYASRRCIAGREPTAATVSSQLFCFSSECGRSISLLKTF